MGILLVFSFLSISWSAWFGLGGCNRFYLAHGDTSAQLFYSWMAPPFPPMAIITKSGTQASSTIDDSSFFEHGCQSDRIIGDDGIFFAFGFGESHRFHLANNIQSFALGIFGVAFSVAVFPSLSLSVSEQKEKIFFTLLADTTRRLFFVLPLSAFMIVFRAQFVRVILGSGQFNWEDTIVTFNILALLSMSLFAQSLIPLFTRGFFALQDTKTPLFIACGAEIFHIGLLLALKQSSYFSIEALALVFSFVTIINFSFLYLALKRRLSYWNDARSTYPYS